MDLKLWGTAALLMRSEVLTHEVSEVTLGISYGQVSLNHHGLIDKIEEVKGL